MNDLVLLKPNNELMIKFDYFLDRKNEVNWKEEYLNYCRYYNLKPISQGNLTDEDFYKRIHLEYFQYYLLRGEEIIGRACITLNRNETIAEISTVLIENEFRGCGYGKKFFELLERDIFSKNQIEKIIAEDFSQYGQTTKILSQLGYVEDSFGRLVKYKADVPKFGKK